MARKVNTRFLIIITAVLAVLIAAAVLVPKFLNKGDPKEFIANAEKFAAEGKYPEAVKNYGQALAIDPENPELLVGFGDLLASLAWTDDEYIGRSRAAWEKALELDPSNIPALTRMLEFWEEVAQIDPRADTFTQLRTVSQKLINADSNNVHARGVFHAAIIRQWLAGVETDRVTIEDNLKALVDLKTQDPSNPDLPFYIAQVKIFDGQAEMRQRNRERAHELFAEADAVMNSSVEAQPDNAKMHYRYSQVLSALAVSDYDSENPDLYKTKYLPRIKSALAKSVGLVKPDDREYVEIQLKAASFAREENRLEDSEKIYKMLMEQRPDDQFVRLSYAKFLAATRRRPDAIEQLARPIEAGKSLTGVRAMLLRYLRSQTMLDLTNLRLDEYAEAGKGEGAAAKKQKLMAQIDESYSLAFGQIGETADTLKLKGKMQLLKDENVEAIQSLNKARELLKIQNRPKDSDLDFMLARAYTAAQQTGAAKDILKKIIEDYPNFLPAKVLMAQSLIREQDMEGAKPYVEELEKALPTQPEIVRMRLALLDKKKDVAEIDLYYSKLPEKTRQERIDKAQIATLVSKMNEAVRLLSLILSDDPKDKPAGMALANILNGRNQKSEALEVVNNMLRHYPGDNGLELLKAQLQGADVATMSQKIEELVNTDTTDPFQKELQLAELARRQEKPDEMFTHLKNAEKLKSDDPRVWQQLFDYYLTQKKWAEAASYADKLGKVNADQAKGLLYRYRMAKAKGELNTAINVATDLTKAMPEFSRSWSTLGEAYQAAGFQEEALQRFDTALKIQPTNIDAMKGIIAAYYAVSRPDDAKVRIDAGRDMFPDDPEFQRFDVEHKLNYGDPEEAVAPLEDALKRKSNSPPAYAAVGNAYLKVARKKAQDDAQVSASFLQKARDTFTHAQKKWPEEPIFYGYLAEIALFTGNIPEGEKILQQLQARAEWKERPEPLMALADFYVSAGKFDLAQKALHDAMAKAEALPETSTAPAGTSTAVARTDMLNEIRFELASVLANPQVKKYDESLAVLEPVKESPRFERQRIEIMLTSGRLADAEAAATAALAKRPDSVDHLNLLAIIHLSAKQPGLAVEPLERAIKIDPKNFTALYHLGLVRLQQQPPDLEAAISLLVKARDINPRNPETRVTLANAYRQRNDLNNAAAELEAALTNAPLHRPARVQLLDIYRTFEPPRWSDYQRVIESAKANPQLAKEPEWHEQEAQMWLKRGDKAKAIAVMQETLKAGGTSPAIVNSYLNMLAETGNYRELIQHTDVLLSQNIKGWWVYSARGVALSNLNKRDAALAEFGTALQMTRDENNDVATEAVIRTMGKEIGLPEAIRYVEEQAKADPRWRLMLVSLHRSNNDDSSAMATLELLRNDFAKLSEAQQLNALRLEGNIYLTSVPPYVDKAERAYRELLARKPDDSTALNNMACLLAEQSSPPRPQEALEFSQRAYDQMTRRGTLEPLVADTHGWVLTLLDKPEGLNILENLVRRAPFMEAHYHLGEAYLKRQYAEEAQQQLRLADDLLQRAQKNQEKIDPQMMTKITNALTRAQEMIRAKTQAQAP